jgi:hypothetical protein
MDVETAASFLAVFFFATSFLGYAEARMEFIYCCDKWKTLVQNSPHDGLPATDRARRSLSS